MTQMPILILPQKRRAIAPIQRQFASYARCVMIPLDAAAGPWEVWGCAGIFYRGASRTSTVFVRDQLPTSHGRPRVGLESGDHHLSPLTDRVCLRLIARPVTWFATSFPSIGVVFTAFLPLPQLAHTVNGVDHGAPHTMLSFVARFMRTSGSTRPRMHGTGLLGHFSMFHQDECRQRREIRDRPLARLDRAGWAGIVALVQYCRRSIRVAPIFTETSPWICSSYQPPGFTLKQREKRTKTRCA